MANKRLSEIKKIVEQGENHFIEFKRKVNNIEKLVKELVSFANSDGGTLIAGVSDNKQLLGLNNPDGDLYQIIEVVKESVSPSLQFTSEMIPLNSKNSLLCIEVPVSVKKPHYYIHPETKKKEVYIRINDECVRASYEMVKLLQYRKKEQGVIMSFGEVEKSILRFFQQNHEVSISEIRKELKLKKSVATAIMVKLALAGVLKLVPRAGKEDVFIQV